MSEVASRSAASRGRGSGRGGRGGFAGRGGRRTNGDKPDQKTAAEDGSGAFDDEGDVAELRKLYGSKTSVIREMFPDWSEVDVLFALQETNGDENDAVTRIAEGTISQWGEVSKSKKTTKPKAKDTTAATTNIDSAAPASRPARGGRVASEAGRGRGRATERGGARGGRGRSVQPATNGPKGKENTQQLSVPTEESTAFSTEKPKAQSIETKTAAVDPPLPSNAQQSAAAAAQSKTWASMLRQSTAPKIAPKLKEAPAPTPSETVETLTAAEPTPVESQPAPEAQKDETTPVADQATPAAPPPVVEPEVAVPPSTDELTKTNLEQVVDESNPPGTTTAASTAADSWDPRQNPASATATPLSAAQQQHQAQRSNVSGYAATAAKATATRVPAFQRRVMDQEEAVRMPGNREVDRAAVQFGAFNLNGGDEDVDGDREEPETRAQPPPESPVAQPRASLPPVSQPANVPDALQQHKSAAASAAQAPGSTQSMSSAHAGHAFPPGLPAHDAAAAQPPVPNAQQFGRFGQAGPQDMGAGAQKPVDPFNQQQTPTSQPPFDNFPAQTSQPQSHQPGAAAYSSAPNEYSSYYTANQQDRHPYNYYGQHYGQQQQQQAAHGQQDGVPSQPRGFGGYNAGQSDNLSQYPQSGSIANQPRFGSAANDSSNSGHSTPNPTQQAAQQQQQQQQQHPAGSAPGAGSQPQSHGGQYPGGYGHPYYSNPYYHQYYSGYGQGGFGPYGGKGGMYGQPYGMSPNGPYDHSSSPAGFGQSSLHRDSGLSSSVGDYGRSASGQTAAQPGLGGSSFGSVHDGFARGGSSFQSQGQAFGSQAQPAGSSSDDLKPFGDSKAASGPSPSIGGARPGSATNTGPASQSGGLPPPQASQMGSAYGGYPSHLQGHGVHGGSAYGMGSGAGAGQHGSNPYGSYGQFGSGGYYGGGQQQQRGGWGGNYH